MKSVWFQPPFEADTEEELFDSIMNDEVFYPAWLNKDSVSICKGTTTYIPVLGSLNLHPHLILGISEPVTRYLYQLIIIEPQL